MSRRRADNTIGGGSLPLKRGRYNLRSRRNRPYYGYGLNISNPVVNDEGRKQNTDTEDFLAETVVLKESKKPGKALNLIKIAVLGKSVQEHHTYDYKHPDIILRRGQPFTIEIEFDRVISKKDIATLEFAYGRTPLESKGTNNRLDLDLQNKKKTTNVNGWGVEVLDMDETKVRCAVSTTADSSIGIYRLFTDTRISGNSKPEARVIKEYKDRKLILLFNAWEQVLSCDYPDGLQSSTWYDSGKGQLTFTTNRMSGWSVPVYSSAVNSWDCFLKNDKYVLSRSSNVVTVFSVDYYAYLCMDVTMVTGHSYYYYLRHDTQQNANDERVYVIEATISVTSLDQACTPTSGPVTEEFHVLIRQGNESNAKSWCPSPLLGSFEYTYDGNVGMTSCGAGSIWDVCTDRTTMTFNYTLCSTVLAFSQEGEVYCTVVLQSGSTYYVSVLNPGSVDGASYYRFTCLSVSFSGSTVYTSQRPGECEVGQTPQTAPSSGATMTLTPYYTCPFTSASATGSTSTGSGVYAGAVAGIILGLLLSVMAAIVVLVLYKKCKNSKNGKEDRSSSKSKAYMKRGYTFERDPTNNTTRVRNSSDLESSIIEELDHDVTDIEASQP